MTRLQPSSGFSTIRLYRHAGAWYALDNRRLFLAKLVCEHGYLRCIPVFPLLVQAEASGEFWRKWEDERKGVEVRIRHTRWRSTTFPTAGLSGGCRWLHYPAQRPPGSKRGRPLKRARAREPRQHQRRQQRLTSATPATYQRNTSAAPARHQRGTSAPPARHQRGSIPRQLRTGQGQYRGVVIGNARHPGPGSSEAGSCRTAVSLGSCVTALPAKGGLCV